MRRKGSCPVVLLCFASVLESWQTHNDHDVDDCCDRVIWEQLTWWEPRSRMWLNQEISTTKQRNLWAKQVYWQLHLTYENSIKSLTICAHLGLVLCRFASCALRWSDALIGLDMMFLIAAQTTSFWSILSSFHRVPGSTSVRSRRVTCVSNSFRSSCCACQVVGLWSALNSNESFSNTGKCL